MQISECTCTKMTVVQELNVTDWETVELYVSIFFNTFLPQLFCGAVMRRISICPVL
jgi:hypothetical protein